MAASNSLTFSSSQSSAIICVPLKGAPIGHAFKRERQSRRIRKIGKAASAHEHGPLQGAERVKRQGVIVVRGAFPLNLFVAHAEHKTDGAVPPLRPADGTASRLNSSSPNLRSSSTRPG